MARQKLWSLIAVLLAFALVAAACGDDSDDGSTGDDTTDDAADGAADDDADDTAEDDTADDTGDDAADDTGDDAAGAVTIGDDGRLTSGECAEGENSEDGSIGVTADTVNFAVVSIDYGPLADLGFAASGTDVTSMVTPFVDAVNDAGGVCGRMLDYQPVQYNIIAGEGGEACVQVTEDRSNVMVFGQGGFNEALCIAEAGTVTYTQQDFGESDIDGVSGDLGIIFSRSPSAEQAFGATTEHFLPDLEGKSVGVWYGAVFESQGDAVETEVFPILDDAGIDYISFRTDTLGPSDPEGAAILNTAATEFTAAQVDTVLGFTQTTNHAGLQGEMANQGLIPEWLWSNVGSNSANEIFAESTGVTEIADGERVMTYAWTPPESSEQESVMSCNEQYVELGGEEFEFGTFDYTALANMCQQVDLFVAALTLAGPELTQESLVAALETVPRHPMANTIGGEEFGPGDRYGADQMAEQTYDGSTNTYTTGEPFDIG